MGKKAQKAAHRGARAKRKYGPCVSAPRAEPLTFPEGAQRRVCELLCELRIAESADAAEVTRLERYRAAPYKVMKELETRRRADDAAAPPPPPPSSSSRLSGKVRLSLCAEAPT